MSENGMDPPVLAPTAVEAWHFTQRDHRFFHGCDAGWLCSNKQLKNPSCRCEMVSVSHLRRINLRALEARFARRTFRRHEARELIHCGHHEASKNAETTKPSTKSSNC